MQIAISKTALITALKRVVPVADERSPMAILANVMIDADQEKGTLTLSTTNLELSTQVTLTPKYIQYDCCFCVSAKNLLDRVSAMPEGDIVLDYSGSGLELKSSASKRNYKMPTMPGIEFPKIPQPNDACESSTFPAKTLLSLFSRTMYAMSLDNDRPALSSIQWVTNGDTSQMVATDGHRLALQEVSLEQKIEQKTGKRTLLLPAASCHILRKLAAEAEIVAGSITFMSSKKEDSPIFFKFNSIVVSSKLTNAQFPSYEQVIPKKSDFAIAAPRTSLIDAIRSVNLSRPSKTILQVSKDDSTIKVYSDDSDSGYAEDVVSCAFLGEDKKDLTIGINGKYFIDALSVIDAIDAELSFGDELSPIKLSTGDGHIAVIMPVRI